MYPKYRPVGLSLVCICDTDPVLNHKYKCFNIVILRYRFPTCYKQQKLKPAINVYDIIATGILKCTTTGLYFVIDLGYFSKYTSVGLGYVLKYALDRYNSCCPHVMQESLPKYRYLLHTCYMRHQFKTCLPKVPV